MYKLKNNYPNSIFVLHLSSLMLEKAPDNCISNVIVIVNMYSVYISKTKCISVHSNVHKFYSAIG